MNPQGTLTYFYHYYIDFIPNNYSYFRPKPEFMSSSDKKLFLLDAYALIFRSYFAFARNPRVTSKGMDTSAIFGFTTTLLDLLDKENPTHVAVVFDMSGPTIRHEKYEDYKANRDETPEAIKIAVPYIHRILEAFRIPSIGLAGYEADDLIGTLAKKAEKEGYTTYMMTPDKDYGQLVSEHIFMYKPARGGEPPEVMGVKEICEKWGIQRVDQVIDILGMMGDSVDNIPGLPGVGEKTAVKLLAEYDTLEGVLANADKIKGKLGEKIRDNAELGILSKDLATIIIDAPIEFDEKDLTREELNKEALQEVFEELEFRSLAKKILQTELTGNTNSPATANSPKVSTSNSMGQMDMFAEHSASLLNPELTTEGGFKTIQNSDHLYSLIDTLDGAKLLVNKLLQQDRVCFDTETTSLDTHSAELVGMSFSWKSGRAHYVSIPADRVEATKYTEIFRPFFESAVEKVGQNLKYDISVLKNYNIEVHGPFFDTMLAHYLLQPDLRHNMDFLSETYLHYKPVSIETIIGKKGKSQGNMRDAAVEQVKEYAGEDADITWQLSEHFRPKLTETNVDRVYNTIEVPLLPVLSEMEYAGIKVDAAGLQQYSTELAGELSSLEKEIIDLAGVPFNLGSPRQLGEVLFDRMKLIDKPKKTKTGQYATAEDVLETIKDAHPIIEKILDWRQVGKLKSTYVDALPALIHPTTGRIHTTYNQTVAATGRLSSQNPNLQNIPIRTERGQRVRSMFIAGDDDKLLLAADYSQIELRIIAAMSQDEAMIEAFRSGEDIHKATAAKVFGVPLAEVTREQRSQAKTVNFGIIYGVSAFGLSQQTNLSRTEAKEIIEAYFKTYPGIKSYIDKQVASARETGFVETVMGRRRYLKDIHSRNQVVRGHAERNAINAPIQGSAADIIKLAMIRIHDRMIEEKFESKMVLQVHDELVFDALKSEESKLEKLVVDCMEGALELSVPLIVDVGRGKTWLEAH